MPQWMGVSGGGMTPLMIQEWIVVERREVVDGANTTVYTFEWGGELWVREVACAVPKVRLFKNQALRYDAWLVFPQEAGSHDDPQRFIARLPGVNTYRRVLQARHYFLKLWPLTEERETVHWTRGSWHELDNGWRFEVQDTSVLKERSLWLSPPPKGWFAPIFPQIGRRPKALEMTISGPLSDAEVARVLGYIAVL